MVDISKKGYILLARAIEDSDIWHKPPYYIKAWIYILNKVAFKPYGNLDVGECFITIDEIQDQCMYKAGRRTEKPSRKQIRDFIEFLKSHDGNDGGNDESHTKGAMIVTKKVKDGMLVNVLNYERYQTSANYESNNESSDESQMKDRLKSDESNMKVPNNKEALKALKHLEELKENTGDDDLPEIDESKKENELKIPYAEIVEYLNKKLGTKYKPSTSTTKEVIQARYNQGFDLQDFKTVIDKKCDEWVKTEFAKFLRPSTLFGNKFEGYLNQMPSVSKKEKELPSWFNDQNAVEVDTSDFDEKELEANLKALRGKK